jgi:8-oxo-dGTP pyrophosphatase MutT (NUDIX family)
MQNGPEKITYQGKIIEVVEKPVQMANGKTVIFESARRSPGTRIIIAKDGKVLLSKEFRTEINGYDYRLPGGKVFDTLEEYNAFLKTNGNIEEKARAAIVKEALEEVGIAVTTVELLGISKCGATVEWDLYYFLATDFSETERRDSGEGEDITTTWVSIEEAKTMCLDGRMQEERSALMLLRYLSTNA